MNSYWNEKNDGIGTCYHFNKFMMNENVNQKCRMQTVEKIVKHSLQTSENMISGYSNQILSKLTTLVHRSEQVSGLSFYHNVYLPRECGMIIVDFLMNRDKIGLFMVCESSYQFIKQYCIQNSNIFIFGSIRKIRQWYEAKAHVNHLHWDLILDHKYNNRNFELDDINWRDLSLLNDKDTYLMIDTDIFNQNIQENRYTIWYDGIEDCVANSIIVSLMHYNRLILKLNRRNTDGCVNHEINISITRLPEKMVESKDSLANDRDDDLIVWYWKASDSTEWNEYPAELQNHIETHFVEYKMTIQNGENIETDAYVIINDNYRICFDTHLTEKEPFGNNSIHSIWYSQWAGAFTQYFHQQNVQNGKFRVVKRVNFSQKNRYVESLNVIESYFGAQCSIKFRL